jgi:hypothetical protein
MWQAVSAFAAGGEEALQMSGGQAATLLLEHLKQLQAPCIPLHNHHRCFRLRDRDRQRFAAAVLNSTTFFVRPAAQRSNGRARRPRPCGTDR